MKVVVNRCYGGFGISHEAVMRYAELHGWKLFTFTEARDKDGNLIFGKFVPHIPGPDDNLIWPIVHYSTKPLKEDGTYEEDSYFYPGDIARDDPMLIQVVEELGPEANGPFSRLEIVEIPDGIKWVVDEYDGMEHVEEEHRSW